MAHLALEIDERQDGRHVAEHRVITHETRHHLRATGAGFD